MPGYLYDDTIPGLQAPLGWFDPVAMFGADPTGVADSTAAINSTIAALPATGAVLYFRPGTFKISAALSAIPANVIVLGAGEYATTLSFTSASATLLTLTGTNATLQGVLLLTSVATTSVAVLMSATQCSLLNVSISGFFTAVSMNSSATFANIFNGFISSGVASAIGIIVAGGDTTVGGLTFSAVATGMSCGATDRFAIADCVFKNTPVGVSFTNTAATGSTAVAGCTFDGATTAIAIIPGTGGAVSNLALVGFTIDGATTGISLAPTGSGTVIGIDIDGVFYNCTTGLSVAPAGTSTVQSLDFDGLLNACTTGITLGGSSTGAVSDVDLDVEIIAFTTGIQFTQSAGPVNNVVLGECIFDTSTASATAISFAPTATGTSSSISIDGCIVNLTGATSTGLILNGPASSLSYMVVDATQFIVTGTGFNASAANFGGAQTAKPVTFVNCPFNCTVAAANPAVGATNTQPFVFRGCVGVNPAGKTTTQPATAAATTNNLGCDVQVAVAASGATTLLIGGQVALTLANGNNLAIRVPYGQTWGYGTPANAAQVVFGD